MKPIKTSIAFAFKLPDQNRGWPPLQFRRTKIASWKRSGRSGRCRCTSPAGREHTWKLMKVKVYI